ncbi:MAG: pyridoxal-phosphate dependent enzyme [Verrucomicrobia bacterium]|nr:pyridoxal-phosphate dependent enzyme [Verrucomicrobiota bacterium]
MKHATSPLNQLWTALNRLPRVALGQFPTPLDEAPRLGKTLGGPRIFIKRDDLSGLAFGGNKTRMFEYVLGYVIQKTKHDCIIAGAGVQSNYCRQLSAACAKLNIPLHLMLRKVRPQDGRKLEGSYLIDVLCGAKVEIIDGDWTIQRKRIVACAKKLRTEGRNPYIARAGSNQHLWLYAAAYVHCFAELWEQLAERGIQADALYMTSSDTTQAGALVGAKFLKAKFPIYGIDTVIFGGDSVKVFVQIARDTEKHLGLKAGVGRSDVHTTDAFLGAGYGQPTPEGLEAIKLLARTEGILCDPVYTGKGLACLVADIRKGKWRKDQTVIFLHTGGAPALFAYADSLGL